MEKPLVLVAEDNDATAALIRALLRNEFRVDRVCDGREAIERLKSGSYTVVLLDLLMPGADGFLVLEYLNAERPELLERVIVVTAAVTPRELQRLEGYRIRGVIAKPFDVEVLQDEVRRCQSRDGDGPWRTTLITSGMLLLLDLLR